MAKALVHTSGEWLVAEIIGDSNPKGQNAQINLKVESGSEAESSKAPVDRDLRATADEVIILDRDCPDWFAVAQFLADSANETLPPLGTDGVKAYRTAQSLATRIVLARGVKITPPPCSIE